MTPTILVRQDDTNATQSCLEALGRGGTIIFPTETCYGLGADATNARAVERVYTLKGRPQEKHIAIACSSLEMARKYIRVNADVRALAHAFLPGPLTIVSQGQSFRIPDHRFTLALISQFGKPLTATSANTSGAVSLYAIADLIHHFDGLVDVIVDAGDLLSRQASTVYDVDTKRVLREGPISLAQLRRALNAAQQ